MEKNFNLFPSVGWIVIPQLLRGSPVGAEKSIPQQMLAGASGTALSHADTAASTVNMHCRSKVMNSSVSVHSSQSRQRLHGPIKTLSPEKEPIVFSLF